MAGKGSGKKVEYLRVRNWDRFQYRSDKTMPWIRSYNEQLEDYEYTSLSDSERGHLHDIRLLANRTKNKIPADPNWIRAAIRSRRAPHVQRLVDLGFLEPWVPDNKLPAKERVPDALRAHSERPESVLDREETEREIEKRREKTKAVPAPRHADPATSGDGYGLSDLRIRAAAVRSLEEARTRKEEAA